MTENDKNSELEKEIIKALKTCYDPEIPINIYDLGLIYNIAIGEQNKVEIAMTLTSPACPVAGILPGEVEAKARSVEGVGDVTVDLVWDPPWGQHMMSEEAQLELGLF
ncbi:MAG: SUF system Fe-S cluster assembly protein [bacterium]|jgi:FeS assembly SUF system protein